MISSWRDRYVDDDHVRGVRHLFDRLIHARNVEVGCGALRDLGVQVETPNDVEIVSRIRGQVCVVDNSATTNDRDSEI